jgi:cytochrome c oxidase subunit 3
MWIFLAALGVFFAAAIVGYLAVRAGSESWPPPGMPPLPRGMWLATALLLGASYTVETALRRIRAGLPSALKRYLASTLALLLAFLLVQVWNWRVLLASEITARSNLYAFTFFLLTGLHGAHVLGGIAAVAAVTARAWKGRYGSGFHPGVHYSALYVHFLDGVWLVLFVVLHLSR